MLRPYKSAVQVESHVPLKILFDTDPGVDDAMALLFALNSHELEVVGVTTVYGNAEVEQTTRNALRVLEVAGRTDIPVAAGAARPLVRAYRGKRSHIHGEDALGNTFLPRLPPARSTSLRRSSSSAPRSRTLARSRSSPSARSPISRSRPGWSRALSAPCGRSSSWAARPLCRAASRPCPT